jgi:hypothetical protein
MIPKKIHYIFGLDDSFCNKPFTYFHYLNVCSAKYINPGYEINVYYKFRPPGEHFTNLASMCNLIKLDEHLDIIYRSCNFIYTEHICDLLRLDILLQFGGIYLDMDTVCVRSFDDLLNHACTMGMEITSKNTIIGLCNALIISSPQNQFIQMWRDRIISDLKNPESNNTSWNLYAVQFPYKLSSEYPELIHVEDHSSFFKYAWDEIGATKLFIEHVIRRY